MSHAKQPDLLNCHDTAADIRLLDPVPDHVVAKATEIVQAISTHPERLSALGCKKLKAGKDLIGFRLNIRYRMLVRLNEIGTGPYLCMHHDRYDRLCRSD